METFNIITEYFKNKPEEDLNSSILQELTKQQWKPCPISIRRDLSSLTKLTRFKVSKLTERILYWVESTNGLEKFPNYTVPLLVQHKQTGPEKAFVGSQWLTLLTLKQANKPKPTLSWASVPSKTKAGNTSASSTSAKTNFWVSLPSFWMENPIPPQVMDEMVPATVGTNVSLNLQPPVTAPSSNFIQYEALPIADRMFIRYHGVYLYYASDTVLNKFPMTIYWSFEGKYIYRSFVEAPIKTEWPGLPLDCYYN